MSTHTGRGLSVTMGDRLPADPARRRRVAYRFGPARPLHLGDYLGAVRMLRVLAADPLVDLTIIIDDPAEGATAESVGGPDAVAHAAATLVACGLGSVSFRRGGGVEPGSEGAGHEAGDVDEAVDGVDGVAGLARVCGLTRLDGAAVVHDLRHPRRLMGSVPGDTRGVIHLLDTALRVAAAIRAAGTDLDPTLGYDPQLRPGMANLAVILGALTGRTPIAALFGLHGANELKRAVAEAVDSQLRPVRQRYADLARDGETMRRLVEPSRDGTAG